MDTVKLGAIGTAFLEVLEIRDNAIRSFEKLENDAVVFLDNWKAELKAYRELQKKLEAARKAPKVNTLPLNDSHAGATGRPTRNARNVAINNIRKQTLLPLNRKMRRPGSDEMNETGSVVYIGDQRTTLTGGVSIKQEKIDFVEQKPEVVEFAKPKPRGRKRKNKQEEDNNVTEIIETSILKPEVLTIETDNKENSQETVNKSVRQTRSRSGLKVLTPDPVPAISPILAPETTNSSMRPSSVVVFEDPIERNSTANKSILQKTITIGTKKRKMNSTRVSSSREESLRRSSNYQSFEPTAESSMLAPETRECLIMLTPLQVNGTYVVTENTTTPRSEPFANQTMKTVVRKDEKTVSFVKENSFIEDSIVENVAMQEEEVATTNLPEEKVSLAKETLDESSEVEFQAPLPVAPKRTKPVKNPKCFNKDGWLTISPPKALETTKVLDVPTVPSIPDVSIENRPVRTRTKVRRFGVEEETQPDPSTTITVTSTSRSEEPRRKSKTEKPIVMQSKARRASRIVDRALLSKLKTPASHIKLLTDSNTNSSSRFQRPMILVKKNTPLALKATHSAAKIVPSSVSNEEKAAKKLKEDIAWHKEELAIQKRTEEINKKKKILKQRNEKLLKVKNNKAKIEEHKQELILAAEREKEEKRKQLLKDREQKLKEEAAKKKLLAEKKMAENEERRRLEHEAKLAKIEQEQQKQREEKQRQLELEEKRAKERAEERKKMLAAEKMLKTQMAAATKAQQTMKTKPKVSYTGMYLPMNEDDIGLENELSDCSGDEDTLNSSNLHIPQWVEANKKDNPIKAYLKVALQEYFSLPAPTANIQKMFNMSPSRVFRRTSSAIWNASTFTP